MGNNNAKNIIKGQTSDNGRFIYNEKNIWYDTKTHTYVESNTLFRTVDKIENNTTIQLKDGKSPKDELFYYNGKWYSFGDYKINYNINAKDYEIK